MLALSYLIRVEPYTSIFVDHNGKFGKLKSFEILSMVIITVLLKFLCIDSPNRMLSDVEEAWMKVCESTQCNNELSPEWFYLPRIFQNNNYIGKLSSLKNGLNLNPSLHIIINSLSCL